MFFGDVLYVDSIYRPEDGNFSKLKKGCEIINNRYPVGQWHYCRDIFHTHLYNCNLFFFSHKSGKGKNIATFMRKIEDILNVSPISEYGPTQRKTIMWIKPSKWWTVGAMRRSLFTILLRVGSQYSITKDNFYETLFSHRYLENTKYALERFLSGCTKYTGRKRGWYKQFYECHPTKKNIDTLLIRP